MSAPHHQSRQEDIRAAIRSLKKGKAPGQDNLDAELFKVEPEFVAQVIPPLFAEKQLPDDWTTCHREDSEEGSPEQL